MIFRNLDSDGDWTFGKGAANYARAERAIELNLRTRLLSWVGNCFFDLQAGIDWRARLDKGQRENLLNDLRVLILQSFGVVGINSVDATLDPETRAMRVRYDIETIYSQSFQREVEAAAGAGS